MLCEPMGPFRSGEINRNGVSAATSGTNLRDDRLGLLGASAIVNHDPCSRLGKGKRARASDTARSPCDEGSLSRKTGHARIFISAAGSVRRLALVRGGTFEKREPSPSAMVGCARMASRRSVYGSPASIAVCTEAMTSPASGPIIVKPRMRSSRARDKRFHKALCLADCVRPEHGAHRQFCDTRFDALTLCLAFAQSTPVQAADP